MKHLKRGLTITLIGATLFTSTGCSSDRLAKGVVIGGGAVAGGMLANAIAPNSGITGTVVGAGLGAVAAFAVLPMLFGRGR